MGGKHVPVEAKVTAATATSYLTSAGLLAVLAAVQDNARLLDPLPDWISPLVLSIIPGILTFGAGWEARHSPRLGGERG
ncbi:holin [Streptomyces sp. EKR5.2]|uniref:holin n=1 Tax=Streptomyces sp. EKR5.2 TaxID=3461014 RepID=UPI004041F3C9